MLFVDIDGLKMINDTFGHQAGDQALIQVAEMLAEGVRGSDCVARLGGDDSASCWSAPTRPARPKPQAGWCR